MVDNISQAGNSPAPIKSENLHNHFFPDSDMSGQDIHKFISQWVNNVIQTLHSQEAQMKKANQELRKSEDVNNG